jgi:UDP-glucose-4-epimerase GalE
MRIFVTGGAGYVGSHCVRDLCAHGHDIVVYDNLTMGHCGAVDPRAKFVEGDLADVATLRQALSAYKYDAAMHFAALAQVGESVREPIAYYRANVCNTLNLLEALRKCNVLRLVFSSTCATYGEPETVPITESESQTPINPYGRSKLTVEWMLADSAVAWNLGSCSLRYFNACGAAADGSIGEDHRPETHIIPLVLQTAMGQRKDFTIFGTDYDTPDGTCIRDYIHVEDLAFAHRLAIEVIEPGQATAYDVGTGTGHSVREIVDAARKVTGKEIPIVEGDRREGDPPVLVADGSLIREKLGWTPRWTEIDDVVASAWKWHKSHPDGFGDD